MAAHATVTLDIFGGYLKFDTGVRVPNGSGLLLLVGSADPVFDPVSTTSVFTVDAPLNPGTNDYVLAKSSISGNPTGGLADAGEFEQVKVLTLGASASSGNVLQLYWFPTLTSQSTSALEGTIYGTYRSSIADSRDALDQDNSAPWFVPADGSSKNLIFLTSDAQSARNTATSGTQFGEADLLVIPEPATGLLLGAGFCGLLGWRRRSR